MRRETVAVKSGKQYNYLFPQAMLLAITKKRDAKIDDTLKFIPRVVRETLFHTSKIAKLLKGSNLRESCSNIWHFVYDHIAYKKDEDGKEQVRSPARTWNDRHHGVDCDCYSVFISSILSNLKIPHVLRITKYKQDHFQHIYPIVPTTDGNYITIDCVVNEFDYEEPYSEKKDTTMDLEYLNGVGNSSNIDANDMYNIYDDQKAMQELGAILNLPKISLPIITRPTLPSNASKPAGMFQKAATIVQKVAAPVTNLVKNNVQSTKNAGSATGSKSGILQKAKEVVSKAVHAVNTINPATILLRTGVLAAMKLNLFKVAQRIKWAYLSDAAAQSRGIDMNKFKKLKEVKAKLENIFFGAGGKPENLKAAILTGKGNANHEVNGLGYTEYLNGNLSISRLLGDEIYESENISSLNGLGELGEPVSAATISAASGAIAALASILKTIGDIFLNKNKNSKDFEESPEDAQFNPENLKLNELNMDESGEVAYRNSAGTAEEIPSAQQEYSYSYNEPSSSNASPTAASTASYTSSPSQAPPAETKTGFWAENKKWILPVSITVGGLVLIYAGYRMMKKPKALSGIPIRSKKKKGGYKPTIKSKKSNKKKIALL